MPCPGKLYPNTKGEPWVYFSAVATVVLYMAENVLNLRVTKTMVVNMR